MLCPLFKKVTEDWCLRDNCKWFDGDIEKCVYATYQRLKTEPKDAESVGSIGSTSSSRGDAGAEVGGTNA